MPVHFAQKQRLQLYYVFVSIFPDFNLRITEEMMASVPFDVVTCDHLEQLNRNQKNSVVDWRHCQSVAMKQIQCGEAMSKP